LYLSGTEGISLILS